jgi:hypothetical protein
LEAIGQLATTLGDDPVSNRSIPVCIIVATGLVLLLAFLALSGGAAELTALAAVLAAGTGLVANLGNKGK